MIIDIILLLSTEIVLKKIPAPFPLFVVVGDITVALEISFLASFIFYFVQIHMPETKQKNDLYPCLAVLYARILFSEKELLTNYVGAEIYESLSEEVIIKGAKIRDKNKYDAPLFLAGPERRANWLEYGLHKVNEIDKNCNMLMNYSMYLDSDCLVILSKIQDDSTILLFKSMKYIYTPLKKTVPIIGIEVDLVRFWHFIQEQEYYYNRVFSPYKKSRIINHLLSILMSTMKITTLGKDETV